jgi:hypothetical protein
MKPASCAIADETAHHRNVKVAGMMLRIKKVNTAHRRLLARTPVAAGSPQFVPMKVGNSVAIGFQHRSMTLRPTQAETMCARLDISRPYDFKGEIWGEIL